MTSKENAVLTSSNILDLMRGISYDDAKKFSIRLGIPLNTIDNIRSTHTNPELYGHALISVWQKDCEGSEGEAISQLATALRNSNLCSYAADLMKLVGHEQTCQHSPQSWMPRCPSTVQPSQLSQESSRAESPEISRSQSLQVASSPASSHLSQAESSQSQPHCSTVPPPQDHVELPEAFRLVSTAIINLKDCKGCTQKDVIAYIFANCDACKDSRICKRALIKGIKRGLVTHHERHDGRTGFKLAKTSRCHRKHRPTRHRCVHPKYHQTHTHQWSGRLTHGQHKHHLAHDLRRNFKHRQIHPRDRFIHLTGKSSSNESSSDLRTTMNFSSSVCGEDITTAPIPFPTPGGDDITPPDYTTTETPQEAHDVTYPLSPFPTPGKEETKSNRHPRKKGPLTVGEILRMFFIADIGRCDYNTIASVGCGLLGDDAYQSIFEQEKQEQCKRIVIRVFEEWERKRDGDIDFYELQNTFQRIECKELIDKMQVYLRSQTRLFSFD